jgi:hypothetical protein
VGQSGRGIGAALGIRSGTLGDWRGNSISCQYEIKVEWKMACAQFVMVESYLPRSFPETPKMTWKESLNFSVACPPGHIYSLAVEDFVMIGVSPHLARVAANEINAPKFPKWKKEKEKKKEEKTKKNILSLHSTPLWYCTVSLPFISPFCLLHIQTSTSTYTLPHSLALSLSPTTQSLPPFHPMLQ